MSRERKFLHDIATPMAVFRLTLKQLETECDKMKAQGKIDNPKICQWFIRVNSALEKMEHLHAEHKAYLSTLKEEEKVS